MILLRTEVHTDLVCDCFIIQVYDKEVSVSWLLSEILRKYHEWHPFKVYEFEIQTIKKNKIDSLNVAACDTVLSIFNVSEAEFHSNQIKQQMLCKVIESEKSKLQRKEDEKREEELRLERLRIEAEKKKKRDRRIKELKLRCNCWELHRDKYSQFLDVPLDGDDGGQIVVNTGSLDQWCSIRFITPILPSFNKFFFSVKLVSLTETTNTWKICIGAVPIQFKIKADRHWVGAQKSWSYIAGTGGKCHNSGKSIKYGEQYAENDVISVLLNFDDKNIEFFKNGKSQGIAFTNLSCAVIPAVSFTAKHCKLKLINFINDEHLPQNYRPFMIKNVEILKNYIKQREHYLSNEFECIQNEIWKNNNERNMFYPRFSSYHYPESLYFECSQKYSIVTNNGSGDKWRIARTFGAYYPHHNIIGFEFEILNDAESSNTWRICCGVIPIVFDSTTDKIWVGAQSSWSYIAGTGGKCFNSSQSCSYGERYSTNDKISVVLDFTQLSIEFFKNGESQGVAFSDCAALKAGVYGAVSFTASGTSIKFNSLTKAQSKQLKVSGVKQREILENVMNKYGNIWDRNKITKHVNIIDRMYIESSAICTKDKWNCVASLLPYKTGRRYFEVELCTALDTIDDDKKNNKNNQKQWKVCVGVVPKTFDFNHSKKKLWIGAQNSWSLTIGTGGKCYNSSKSQPYTKETFCINDKIGVLMDFDNHTLEFYKNDQSLGQAFNNLYGPVYAAVSIAINQCKIRFIPQAETQKIDTLFLFY